MQVIEMTPRNKQKINKGKRFLTIAQALDRSGNEAMPPGRPWPHHYVAVEMSAGARVIGRVLDGEVIVLTDIDQLVNDIVAWNQFHVCNEWIVTYADAREIAKLWRGITTPIPNSTIRQVRWLSEGGYTWGRLPWDQSDAATPTWDDLLSRVSNAEAFKAFIGSLFFDEAKQHQYVWMYGMGGDGKGAINRFLAKVFNTAYRSKQPPPRDARFWTYGLIGARVVVFPDCNSRGFTASGLFKSLSGGDPVDVEAKGSMGFTTNLHAKYLFLSNERPKISSEIADMRRIIYCEFAPNGIEPDPTFEERLWSEGGAFLTKCIRGYSELCPDHRNIPTEKDEIESVVSEYEADFQELFDTHFIVTPNPLYRTSAGVQGLSADQLKQITVEGDTLAKILTEAFPRHRDQQSEFREWLAKRGISRRGVRIAGNDRGDQVRRYYVGMCKKPSEG